MHTKSHLQWNSQVIAPIGGNRHAVAQGSLERRAKKCEEAECGGTYDLQGIVAIARNTETVAVLGTQTHHPSNLLQFTRDRGPPPGKKKKKKHGGCR